MSHPAEPIARLFGQPLETLPADLYIPPQALRVLLERFEGPLDLLLYLIRKQNLDILDIPMAAVTRQYMDYVSAMERGQLELAAEYLLMAAMLIEIKSRMLLPKPLSELLPDEDPRAELVRRLLEYEQMKQAAYDIGQLPLAGRDFVWAQALFDREIVERLPEVSPLDLQQAWLGILARAKHQQHHSVHADALSVREQMSDILKRLKDEAIHPFTSLFDPELGIPMLVVSFIAILELCKEGLIAISQQEPYATIYVCLASVAASE